MQHVSVASLEDKFPGEGRSRYNAIAMLVGGDLAGAAAHEGGLDLTGVFDKNNKKADGTPYFDEDTRARVKALTQNKTADPQPEKEGTK